MPARPKTNLVKMPAQKERVLSTPPDKPEWLSAAASAEWDRVCEMLLSAGRLARYDQMSLSAYCELSAEFMMSPSEFPSSKMTQLRLLMADFGMTPSSRDKLPNSGDGQSNKFEGF